jgi:hypothetical protein
VAFYVKLGPRGLIFQLGTMIVGTLGALIYWRASRRRARVPHPVPVPIRLHDAASEP